MTRITRRTALAGTAGLAAGLAAAFAIRPAFAAGGQVRIGYQKYGTLVLLKGRGILEKQLEPLGVTVSWAEFAAGPQMLEALNAGAIDIGQAGEAPPIFAQAANPNLVYIANEPPAPKGEAILVPHDSPLQSVKDLKGKTVGLNKGSNVHFLLVKALEKYGLAYTDIKTAFLPPADARAAFERGSIDAWAIWDPFQAAAEYTLKARALTTAEGIVPNYQFYLGARGFAEANPKVIATLLSAIRETDDWIQKDTAAAAAQLAPTTGIPAPILTIALARQSFGVAPLTDKVIADQQSVADTFFGLGLLPKKITVADAVLHPAL
ncbi:sulfonate ABC transporter substrate-binding protein [Segnochrobactrum spirostomi]|uniref:Putative aliphatic sulfonates-binding protein n=1 Tax=Segnochrobactrum spirostomi TaxID=2608987 RepID=A0A6A7Y0Y4_9HYPH|nr:sulfonate ABC transporter substrate-binding protein [Segnochrobactrum spirostomi]MQT12563.1 sulfonate ABC transporter substrate-binding protein [Segnochrobactrum spirostomi]